MNMTDTNPKQPRPRVLIADDHEDILAALVMAAEQRGWDIKTARSAQEIIDRVNEHCGAEGRCFDALILDIHYWKQDPEAPRLTGIHAVRKIRRQYPNLAVVFITAYNTRLVRDEALAVGNEVILKPFDPFYVLNRAELWMGWLGHQQTYDGEERRGFGLNRSGHMRRATDHPLEISPTLKAALSEAQAAAQKRSA
jgi:CheY-like chemotaxis protein